MLSDKTSIDAEIKQLEFDTHSAQQWASAGRIEQWVHRYLLTGIWANEGLSDGLKKAERWWNGPIEVKLSDLSPAVGAEPGMEFVIHKDDWYARTNELAKSLSDPSSIPPLITEYRGGELSVRDGNTRYEAMRILGWPKCWVVIWYNSKHDFNHHNEILSRHKTAQHSVHPTGGSLRIFKQLAWLEAGSAKMASSRPAHQRVTPAVGTLIAK